MFRLIFSVAGRVAGWLQYAPNNRLLRFLRSRRGLRWTAPAMVLGAVYLLAAGAVSELIDQGAPERFYLVTLLFIWNGVRLLWVGPVNFVRSVAQRVVQRRTNAPLATRYRT